MVNPYKDVPFEENCFIRTFSDKVDDEELIWHRDKKDREVRVIKGEGWFLQYDNQLPIEMLVGESYFIKAETYHRVIKGQNNLVLEIKEKGV